MERKHRHLLETARALFLQSQVPAKFWGDSILCATYLINRMPLSSIGNSSPYFKLYDSVPSLDNLRNFGCLCYVTTSKVHRSKFQPRAEPGVFLGYPPNKKGYKILSLTSKQIVISRDVRFHEMHFPFHLLSNISDHDYSNSIFLPSTTTPHSNQFVDDFPIHTTSSSSTTHSTSSDT